jgi:hypothetical protein
VLRTLHFNRSSIGARDNVILFAEKDPQSHKAQFREKMALDDPVEEFLNVSALSIIKLISHSSFNYRKPDG